MHMKSIMLCYNLKGTKKGRKIGMLGSFLGFRVKYVEKEEYSKTIGVLTGLKEEVAEEASREETLKKRCLSCYWQTIGYWISY